MVDVMVARKAACSAAKSGILRDDRSADLTAASKVAYSAACWAVTKVAEMADHSVLYSDNTMAAGLADK